MMSKVEPVVTRYTNTIRKEITDGILSIQRENGSGAENTGKNGIISKYTEGKKKETRVAIGAPAYRRTTERRAAASTEA